MPSGHDLKITVISGIVMLVGGSGLVAWPEQYIASGHAAIITATEPFMFLLLDKKRLSFYFSQKSISGLVLGFGGIVLFFLFARQPPQQEVASHLRIAGMVILFLSAVLWVIGSLYFKRRKDASISNTPITALQLIAAGFFSFLLSLLFGETASFSFINVGMKALGGLLYLTMMGSVVAYLAFTWLLTVRPPAQVSTHTYVNPVVAILMGWWIADEPVALIQLLAVLIILCGVLLTNKKTTDQ